MFISGPKIRTIPLMLMDMSDADHFGQPPALGYPLPASALVISGMAAALPGREFMPRREQQ